MSDKVKLPGFNCGACGFKSCAEMASKLQEMPGLIKRCVHLEREKQLKESSACGGCAGCASSGGIRQSEPWKDTLGREFDFYLDKFPDEPGPREIILPHNPALTKELDIKKGDVLAGRPLGMSCGCPITHCGIAMEVDQRTGVIEWCVTGPLLTREKGFKDLGYYIAEGYSGLVRQKRKELKIGERYFFQPSLCMLQWRHSGLMNAITKTQDGLKVRVEGLWIG